MKRATAFLTRWMMVFLCTVNGGFAVVDHDWLRLVAWFVACTGWGIALLWQSIAKDYQALYYDYRDGVEDILKRELR